MDRTKHRPKLGIICGSGLGELADRVEDADVFPYSEIPCFPVSTVPGHMGKLVFGNLKGKPVVLMRGRLHSYEGGLNPDFNIGDIMIIRDHIDMPGLTGECVLRGKNDERAIAANAAQELNMGESIRQGTYIMIGGPTFETVAESRLLRNFGADSVDKCCLDYDTACPTTHEEVLAIGKKKAKDLQNLAMKIIEKMDL
ncbi:hypothetical protein KUTeg_013266, partial [Tegillarca granosa]